MNAAIDVRKGLEGVVADTTAIALVDGEAGRLYYRGCSIESLAHRRFAEVMHLVVFGELPMRRALRRSRTTCGTRVACRVRWPTSLRELARHGAHPMATLQAITPLLVAGAARSCNWVARPRKRRDW